MKISRAQHTPKTIRAACDRLAALLAVPRGIADAMETHGIEEMGIDSQAGMLCAMDDLARWARAAEMALTDHLNANGAFAAGPTEKRQARPRRRKSTQ